MNPDTNKFEPLTAAESDAEDESPEAKVRRELGELQREWTAGHRAIADPAQLVRPNGEPVPKHWAVFTGGELVELKGYTFRVAYMGESTLLLEPVGPVIGENAQST